MRRAGYLLEKVCDYANLHAAFGRAWRASRGNEEACRFNFRLEDELLSLQADLSEGRYTPGLYRYFMIRDPKDRLISVAPFRDRVMHHAVVAVLRAQAFLRRNGWYLKTDIDKYFDSIDHDTLLGLLSRRIKDRRMLGLLERIIRTSDKSRGVVSGRGLPIGNLTSQFLANVYLDPLDHFVKDFLKDASRSRCDAPFPYVRYMDDMVVFGNGREPMKEARERIAAFAGERLKLRLKPSATLINSAMNGLSFLGLRIFPAIIRVKSENLKRSKARMVLRTAQLMDREISEERYEASVGSVLGHLRFAGCRNLLRAGL